MRLIIYIVFSLFFALLSKAQSDSCSAKFIYKVDHELRLVNFQNTNASDSISYTWSFGNGKSSSLKNPNHFYDDPGIYRVCLITSNLDSSCADTFCTQILIDAADSCKALFIYEPQEYFNFLEFSSKSIGRDLNHQWDFDDGSSPTGSIVTHQFESQGSYNVCLTVSNETCSNTYCKSILIDSLVKCSAQFASYSNRDTLFLSTPLIQANNLESWTLGDGTNTLINSYHIYETSGEYTVCRYIVDTSTYCVDTVCEIITIQKGKTIEQDFSTDQSYETEVVPNPSSEDVKISILDYEKDKSLSFYIYSISAKKWKYYSNSVREEIELDVSLWQKGLYLFIFMEDDKNIASGKFLVQ